MQWGCHRGKAAGPRTSRGATACTATRQPRRRTSSIRAWSPSSAREGLPSSFSSIRWGIHPWNFVYLRETGILPCHFHVTPMGQPDSGRLAQSREEQPVTRPTGPRKALTSVAMTHSSLSSDMTYTDWYFVSFEVEYTESGRFLSDASLLKGKPKRAAVTTRTQLSTGG